MLRCQLGSTVVIFFYSIMFCAVGVASDIGWGELRVLNSPSNHIVPADSAKLHFVLNGTLPIEQLAINIRNEYGDLLKTYEVAREKNEFEFELKGKGYYLISAEAYFADQTIKKFETSIAVTGNVLSEKLRQNSSLGLWHVNGSIEDLALAGAGWSRRMWTLQDYKIDAGGQIISQHRPHEMPAALSEKVATIDGLNWIGTLASRMPSWLNGDAGQGQELHPVNNLTVLNNLVEVFSRDVTVFPPYFEVFNEPEVWWKGTDQELVQFLTTIGSAIKRVHPKTKILAPGFATIDISRFNRLVSFGLLDEIDGVSMHAYVKDSIPEGVFISRVLELKRYLRETGKPDFPIYITEYGWTTKPVNLNWQKQVDEITQARYLSRATILLKSEDVKAAIYFCLNFIPVDEKRGAGFSIQNPDGSPKPSFAAYANATKWLSNTSGGRRLQPTPGMQLAFLGDGGETIAAGWTENSSISVYLPRFDTVPMSDMMGRDIPASPNIIKLSSSPVFWKVNETQFRNIELGIPLHGKHGDKIAFPADVVFLPEGLNIIANAVIKISETAPKGLYLLFAKIGNKWQLQTLDVQ